SATYLPPPRAVAAFRRKPPRGSSSESKLLPILLARHQHRPVRHFGPEHRLLVRACGKRQTDLAAFGRGALQREHDLGAQTGMVETARVHFTVIIQPIGHS